ISVFVMLHELGLVCLMLVAAVVLGTICFMPFAVGFCSLDELGLLGPVWAAGFVCKWHSLC
ncbi:unnamed protein product, partial [Ilex paraguariensis]